MPIAVLLRIVTSELICNPLVIYRKSLHALVSKWYFWDCKYIRQLYFSFIKSFRSALMQHVEKEYG